MKSEIFALGSTFFEILSGQPPFHGLEEAAIQESILNGSFPDLQFATSPYAEDSHC